MDSLRVNYNLLYSITQGVFPARARPVLRDWLQAVAGGDEQAPGGAKPMTGSDRTPPGTTPLKPGPDEEDADLYRLGYVSTQTRPMEAGDLIDLLNVARDANKELGVTGMLLHREDSFFQVIEGTRENVLALFERICSDPRHQRVEVLFQEPTGKREFPDWRMGFVELDGIDVSLLPGFSNFLADEVEPRRLLEELTRSRRLMLLFRAMS
jgi:hypothetical protein